MLKLITTISLFLFSFSVFAEKLTIVSVNNGDMVRMQKLASDFTKKNPGIELDFQFMEENVLRQKVTLDITNKGGAYDIMTIGMYEAPMWGEKGWLVPMNDLPSSFDIDDILPAVRGGLSHNGVLYAAPFYGESSFTMYRVDLFAEKGLTMPDKPTWGEIYKFAKALHNPPEVNGICLRGKPGWGENAAFIGTVANAFGARWVDDQWNPQLTGPAWTHAFSFYVDLVQNYGPKGAPNNGFNENLKLFNQGKCAMWIDATVAASFVTNKEESTVYNKVNFALAPSAVTEKGGWLWSWAIAIPAGTKKEAAAKKFIMWATSKDYIELVADKHGWANVPPGTRTSTYTNPMYLNNAPFARLTLAAMNAADPSMTGTLKPKPYIGVQFMTIPEFQAIGTEAGRQFSAALAGKKSVEDALESANKSAYKILKKGRYIK